MVDLPPTIASRFSDAERLRLALEAADLGDWFWDAATDIVALSHKLNVAGVWIGGRQVSQAS